MSYCRFSSDGFRCDLYLYEDTGGGWTLHIAGARVPEDAPTVPELTPGNVWEYSEALNQLIEYLRVAERTALDLPYAGESKRFTDPRELYLFLDELRELGYRFPDAVLAAVQDDIENDDPCK